MNGDAPLTWLTFFTLAAGLIVAAGFFLAFLRSRHNREIAAYALEGDGRSRGVEPSGAGAELAGLLAVALIAMALLTLGYRSHAGTAASEVAQRNNQLATDRTDPNTPKPYQPQNPAPDTRAAPTSSSTGTGPDSGGRPEGAQK
ncbi:hypothetical protein [Bradyrhizobium guangzhouense]|uniref:Uncharacterized protein n=2 Tax=Bradyrhizobium guangzhouense TaxID=1325095 RepID=A0AAE5WWV5_9BRAD|nr:hypothetical protein [Bradyrhizobium guangzhouense]QAU44390.1 hypothetical protein XH91_02815 [Bradyrhizobium guangzhouense]RXH09304.1 hypothetical protein EAS54_33980 [Bradyrhizobium guangzhouense]RXH10039.1 hypothetical protein EAS56_24165 [Bradyrhizobium guangzhouense]